MLASEKRHHRLMKLFELYQLRISKLNAGLLALAGR